MDALTVFLIAVGLAMDAFAVSIAKGITVDKDRKKTGILLAATFGGFQMLMPAIGWFAGQGLKDFMMDIDHWIAFVLLSVIGGKMIYDSTKGDDDGDGRVTVSELLLLGVATSIDALMVGLSFAFLETSIVVPIIVIGVVTFTFCLAGFVFGNRLGTIFGERVKIVGGVVLILIGLRILIEHTM